MTNRNTDCLMPLRDFIDASDDERSAMLRASSNPVDVLLELGREAEELVIADLDKALDVTQWLTSLSRKLDASSALAQNLRVRAVALSYAGRFNEAISAFSESISIAAANDHQYEAARAQLGSMHVLGERGRFDEAIARGKQAREGFESLGDELMAAKADANIGTLLQRRDDPRGALACFDRARAALVNDPMAVGQIESNRGEALMALNDFSSAESAFRCARDMFELRDVRWASAIADGNLADLAARQGRLHDAIRFYEQARRNLEGTSSTGHLLRLQAEQAETLAHLGIPDQALREYEAVLPQLDEAGMALESARARAGQGLALYRLGRMAEAETALAAAVLGYGKLGHTTSQARVDLLRAEIALVNGHVRSARSIAHSALGELHARPVASVAARHLLARIAMEDNDLDGADAEINVALAQLRKIDVAPLMADVLHTQGLVHARRGNSDRALQCLSNAMLQVERIRGALQAQRFRMAFTSQRRSVYEDLVRVILSSDQPEAAAQALFVADRAKSRSLLDMISGVIDQIVESDEDSSAGDLLGRATQLRGDLNALYSRIADANALDVTEEHSSALKSALREREAELQDIEARIGATSQSIATTSDLIDSSEITRVVDDTSCLIEYFAIADEVMAFTVDHDGVRVHRRLATVCEVNGRVERIRFQINRALRTGAMEGVRGARLNTDVQRELGALHRHILEPLMARIADVQRLVIVPHGQLHHVPFAALHDGEAYVAQRYQVHTAPSAAVLSRLLSLRERASLPSAHVYCAADEHAPDMHHEAQAVAKCLQDSGHSVTFEDRASCSRLLRDIGDASLVHIACHGAFDSNVPRSSGLKLIDRWLNVRDMHGIRLDASLVTLSGCETGRNTVVGGDELTGLLQAFLAAGARSVLASLWRVGDESTVKMMSMFYELWHTGDGRPGRAAQALRLSQIALMETHPHPAHWAPFVLVGRP